MISFILVLLAGFFEGVNNTLMHHFGSSVFAKWKEEVWNPDESWKNKYVDRDEKKGRKKWFGLIPKPAIFSDVWHITKALELLCLFLAIVFYSPWWPWWWLDLITIIIYRTASFELTYNNLIVAKK